MYTIFFYCFIFSILDTYFFFFTSQTHLSFYMQPSSSFFKFFIFYVENFVKINSC